MSNDESTKMHLFVSHRIKHKKIARKNLVPRSFSNQCCFLATSHEVRLRLHTNKHHMYSKKKNAYNSGDANDFYETQGQR